MSDTWKINRLRWRCRRGMRELDALLMRFVDDSFATASVDEQAKFQELLLLPDPEILGLLTGRTESEDSSLNRIVERVLEQRFP